jgi:benzil reductase ((S)-benzoin forming)
VTPDLALITGGSSGIGRALVESVPFEGARVIDISRRGGAGVEHFVADLADPASWRAVAELFDREVAGFKGDRVVFVHCAGTLDPVGFSGEVDAAAYTRQVLLNSAAPQVLGDAFLRAARSTEAACTVLMISSGAAHTRYEGWSAYCAGKAALDHWVRTAGAEQVRRGGRCRVLAVAPGIVETAMQEELRRAAPEQFPDVERFRLLHREGALRTPAEAARDLWELIGRDVENGAVLDLRDA